MAMLGFLKWSIICILQDTYFIFKDRNRLKEMIEVYHAEDNHKKL